MPRPRIEVTRLGKSYGPVAALTDVSLTAAPGAVLGVLGHNGAGKTTLIDILATRALPSTGTARVCGFDVTRSGHQVRGRIGLTSQYASVDEAVSGRANLLLLARLLGASRRQATARAEELLDAFGLTEAADRAAGTYSGGMRRRLDLACGLVGRPEVLFLDEPTTGLDPVSRAGLWALVAGLVSHGTTVVLTTQYLEEADRLADEVVVLAGGHVVAAGAPATLKAGIGSRAAAVRMSDERAVRHALGVLAYAGIRATPDPVEPVLRVALARPGDITAVVRALDAAGPDILDLTVTEPTLDDVYLALHHESPRP
ncbi:ATP-binding cassette domain-containing protein [Actinokineospora guangxiensis]|uniref:ATP-binding cassette domain-containing protein n=1 Tax=Actinokineospora guangxiensis TaxID=1490288 RepID=A0ABW0ERJ3_9PSEU